MEYRGTTTDDFIDQTALALADWTSIFGGSGNDTISISNAVAIGEAGNDKFVGTTPYSSVSYWNSPASIRVDLTLGVANDGFGGQDTFSGIHVIHDSSFDDQITGSAANDKFWLNRGNDIVNGAAGRDEVLFYGVKSTDTHITYDISTNTFTVKKNLSNGDTGVAILKDVELISFIGDGSDNASITKDMFVDVGGFRRSPLRTNSDNMAGAQQIRTGDFNGDGKTDFLVTRINWFDLGVSPVPLQIFLGDGEGGFTDQTATLFEGGTQYVHYVPRIFAADFNNDGRTDIFAPDFGIDAPPFPGGQNSLFVSSPTTGLLTNLTATLPQALRQNHGASIGDVNNDGHLDILVNALNENTGRAEDLLINDGTGNFSSSPGLLPSFMTSPAPNPGHTWSLLADLNNDAFADMVLGTWDPNQNPSQVFLNDGKGSFAASVAIDLPRSGIDKEIVVGIETIDLNLDHLPDLILSVTNGGDSNSFYRVPYLQLLVNDGAGGYRDETQTRLPQAKTVSPEALPDWYLSTKIVDLDHDGFQDIVVDDAGSGVSKIYMNDGNGNFIQTWESASGSHVAVADLNNDDMPDLIVSTPSGFDVLYNKLTNHHIYRASSTGGEITASKGNDIIYNGIGNDKINGREGIDTVIYAVTKNDINITKTLAGLTIASNGAADIADTLVNIERIQFTDTTLAFDTGGNGGQAYRLYQAAFGRTPDTGGLGYWIGVIDKGADLTDVASGFMASAEFQGLYGSNPSSSTLVNKFYQNVLNRTPDQEGLDFWVNVLESGRGTQQQVLVEFSESPENQAALIGVIGNGFSYQPYLG